jgi:hypothetical protein
LVEFLHFDIQSTGQKSHCINTASGHCNAFVLIQQSDSASYKRAKHIKVCFFWLKDLIDNGLIELIFTPTYELVADILTKPLNGEKFIYLLRKLVGWNPLDEPRRCVTD